MKFPRSAGVLLHPTSLPGPNGIGELGPDALRFVDVLGVAGLSVWQMLPLGPTGYGDSPYQCLSAFAGNPLLLHIPRATHTLPDGDVDFGAVIAHKRALLAERFALFSPDARFRKFVEDERAWLDDFALFMAIKEAHDGAAWTAWPEPLARRDPAALDAFRRAHHLAIARTQWEQYHFALQFAALRRACRERGVRLMGDLPIYMSHDSADVWANPGAFSLEDDGRLRVQSGVPPDYFSETGQLWGNPLYEWETMRADGYGWWVRRMRAALRQFDIVRLDHFRGFEAYWEVPGDALTAQDGRWRPGPGRTLFDALTATLGPLPIVAENLGLITPEVEALRESLGFPGMSVLQFAFGGEEQGREFRPHTFTPERVVYTGTHDNDTTVGWWHASAGIGTTQTPAEIARERDLARRYLGTDGSQIAWDFIRAAMASVADIALIPLQDILELGSEARMNAPGRDEGNWRFRFRWEQLTDERIARLREMVTLYDR